MLPTSRYLSPGAEGYCEELNAGGSHRPPSKPPDGESPPEPPPARSEVHPAKWNEIREYKARKMNEARPRKIISRPFGLPKHISIEQYYSNPICMLSAYNYKVEVAVGAKPTDLKQYLSVADTAVGPNLIRADCVPAEILANVNRDRRIVNLLSASQHKLQTIGVVYLWLDMGGYACRQPFVVVRRLAADVIIGYTFLDEHADSLQIRRKVLILADRTVVTIRRRAAGKPTAVRTRERVEVAPLPPKTNLVHVAHRIVLPPQSEKIAKVFCGRTGSMVLDPRPRLYDKRQVSLTNGFADVQANRPFAIRVANFGASERTIAKN